MRLRQAESSSCQRRRIPTLNGISRREEHVALGLTACGGGGDDTGVPVTGQEPEVSVVSGGATILSVRLRDSLSPDAFGISARMGLRGANVFRIKTGDIVREVTITAQ